MSNRVSGKKEHLSDLEDTIMEIIHSEQQKTNEKHYENNPVGFGDSSYIPAFTLQGSRKEKREIKGMKMYLRKLWLKTFQI